MKIGKHCHLHYVITKLKNHIRRYFGFSASETNGLMILVPMVILILAFPGILRETLKGRNQKHLAQDEKILREWLTQSKERLKPPNASIPQLTEPFDPNQITKDKWVALGYDQKIADRIINYRNKGGKFYKKNDLLKIYGIDRKLVSKHLNLLIFPKKKKFAKVNTSAKKATKETFGEKKSILVKTDINLADTSQLRRIRGIGPVLSARIVRFRDALGGFYNLEQLKEVYGITDELFEKISKRHEVKQLSITKVDVNEDSIKVLAKHPYLSYSISKAIVKYRIQHGDYQKIEEIKNVHIISDSIFQKISVYLKTSSTE